MRADPVFYHHQLPEETAEQAAAVNELRKRIAAQYRGGSSVIAFSEDEWRAIGVQHLQTNHYVRVDGQYFQPTGAYTTKAHWYAPPVINAHLYGSAYKTYELKRFSGLTRNEITEGEGSYFDESQWTPEFTHVGSHSGCDGNALIFPCGMLHRIATHSSKN